MDEIQEIEFKKKDILSYIVGDVAEMLNSGWVIFSVYRRTKYVVFQFKKEGKE